MYVYLLQDRAPGHAPPLRMRDFLVFSFFVSLAVGLIYFVILGSCGALAQDAIPGAADAVPLPDGPATAAVNLYIVALGGLTPLVVYLLNFLGPQTSDLVKQLVHAVVAAGVGVLVGAAGGSDFGLNDETLLNAATAMITAALAHFAYSAGPLNNYLGGGLNRQTGDKLFQKT